MNQIIKSYLWYTESSLISDIEHWLKENPGYKIQTMTTCKTPAGDRYYSAFVVYEKVS